MNPTHPNECVVLRLRGGGGDGGSIPGRYDLVDIKKSIMSGNNKGHYKSFDHNSMGWGEERDGDDTEFKIAVAENCAITQTTLKHPVVACKFGYLYNKEALLAGLLTKKLEEQFKHVRNMKDVSAANLCVNPEYSDKVKKSELLDTTRLTHFQCPVTQLPMNGKYKFVLIKSTQCVLSERGFKETKSTNEQGQKVCPMTSLPYEDDDVLILHQHLADPEKYAEEHRAEVRAREEAQKQRKKKKQKKEEKGGEIEHGPAKRSKVDPAAAIKEKSKSSVFTSLFRSKEDVNKKITPEDLLMLAPGSRNGTQGKI